MNPQFFAMKTRRYMHDHGISEDCLTRTAVKNFKNGSLNPKAWRRKALDFEAVASSPLVCDPLRQYHFCSPSEGAAAMVVCRADVARRYTSHPIYLKADVFRTRLYGSFETMSPSNPARRCPGPTVQASRGSPSRRRASAPRTSTSIQVQDTEAGHEIMHLAECGFCKDGEQEALVRDGRDRRSAAGSRSNTDGGLMANGEPDRSLRACARSTRSACSCAGEAGDAPGSGRSEGRATRTSTASPA